MTLPFEPNSNTAAPIQGNTNTTYASGGYGRIYYPPYWDQNGNYIPERVEDVPTLPGYPTPQPVYPLNPPNVPYVPFWPNTYTTTDTNSNFTSLAFKKLRGDAIAPVYGSEQAAGLDLFSVEEMVLTPLTTTLVPTGLAVEIPVGNYGAMRARSSMFKRGILCDGTIDADYRGEVFVMLHNTNTFPITIKKGDKVAQMIISPFRRAFFVHEAAELSDTKRGTGGFGSTGR
jgi:dUTP pyrophosphatase